MLSIKINNIYCLSDALAHLGTQEILTNENTYHCFTCNDLILAKKCLTIRKLSSVFIINFKRNIMCSNGTKALSYILSFKEALDFLFIRRIKNLIQIKQKN